MCIRLVCLILSLLLLCQPVHASMICDGVNDDLTSGLAISTFLSASTGSMSLWYKPTGTASSGASPCWGGEFLMGAETGGVNSLSLGRNGNYFGSVDRLCAYNFSSTEDAVSVAYTANAWTHLAWVHTGGSLLLYKDGALVTSTASGNTASVAEHLRLCGDTGAGGAWGEGVVAYPQVFATALSAAEIALRASSRLLRVGLSIASGSWDLDSCADGVSCNALVFPDRSGNGRSLTANGGTGQGSDYLGLPWGVE
jgi:Concanavalin A-like lectin/glucanases superfamily